MVNSLKLADLLSDFTQCLDNEDLLTGTPSPSRHREPSRNAEVAPDLYQKLIEFEVVLTRRENELPVQLRLSLDVDRPTRDGKIEAQPLNRQAVVLRAR